VLIYLESEFGSFVRPVNTSKAETEDERYDFGYPNPAWA
jgi:hypothetical protein